MLNAMAATPPEELDKITGADIQRIVDITSASRVPRKFTAASIRLGRSMMAPITENPIGKAFLNAAVACGNPVATAVRVGLASAEMTERMLDVYEERPFNITQAKVGDKTYGIREKVVRSYPFGDLIHFQKVDEDGQLVELGQRNMLVVPPMSCHYSPLTRDTSEAHLGDHEGYTIRWRNASMVPSAHKFDKSTYRRMLMEICEIFDGDVHILPVCQSSVPVAESVALLEEQNSPYHPHSMQPAGGPIDTRVSPTVVNRLAVEKGYDWFERTVVARVPWPNPGMGRGIYPGIVQLTGFTTMNINRHIEAHRELYLALVRGDESSAAKTREFYDEYLAVMDLTAEFYLETVKTGFCEPHLALGLMQHDDGRPIDLKAIHRTAIATIEAEKDDITGIGQCSALHDMTPHLPASKRSHLLVPGIGHYGVFSGSKFRTSIVPMQTNFTLMHQKGEPVKPSVIYLRAQTVANKTSAPDLGFTPTEARRRPAASVAHLAA